MPAVRKPFNPRPLISHLTNSNGCGNLRLKVLLTVSPFRPSFPPQSAVYPKGPHCLPSPPTTHYPPRTTHSPVRLFTGHRSRVTSHAFSCACGLFVAPKKVNPFAIKQIQPLFAKTPGWGALCDLRAPISAPSVFRFFLHLTCSQQLTDSLSLFALFPALVFFVFNSIQTLFAKHPGWVWGGLVIRMIRQSPIPPLRPGSALRQLRALSVSALSFSLQCDSPFLSVPTAAKLSLRSRPPGNGPVFEIVL